MSNTALSKIYGKQPGCDDLFYGGYSADPATVLLLHGDRNILDSETTPKTVTNNSVTYGPAANNIGSGSFSFNGSSSYLTVPDSTDWAFGIGDFTIDCWIKFNVLSVTHSIASQYVDAGNRWAIQLTSSNSFYIFFGDTSIWRAELSTLPVSLSIGEWYHIAFVRSGMIGCFYINGISQTLTGTQFGTSSVVDLSAPLAIGRYNVGSYLNGYIDEFRITKGIARWASNFTPPSNPSTFTTQAWRDFQKILNVSINSREFSSKTIVSTYSLVKTGTNNSGGGVLASNGDIHFIPYYSNVGQKVNIGSVSTYSLTYTNGGGAYYGGCLAPNGDIHFIPYIASVGQKLSPSGLVSTYSLAYTTASAYVAGIVALNGDIHFVPYAAAVGQKISPSGVVSTYSLIYTNATGAYAGAVLAPNGDIHFIITGASVGQKVSASGVVSTYSLAYTVGNSYVSGVLAPNGDIHFIPASATVGQKISSSGVISTYSLAYTTNSAYYGGCLASNGEIHFVPLNAAVGQKVNTINGVVSTYSLAYTTTSAYIGGVLNSSGEIHFCPFNATFGQKITVLSGIPLDSAVCRSPFLNKF